MATERLVSVLLYHHVGPLQVPACRGLTVLPRSFARQITTLSAMGYTAITPSDWAAHVNGTGEVPDRCVMITFDDAYADLSEHALPVLEKHGFSATVFVPTSLIGRTINCSPTDSSAQLPIMSGQDISSWAARGVTFGAHSQSHADLTSLSEADVITELDGSRADLEKLTGNEVKNFAYPFGKLNDRIVSLVSERFETAFTIDEGVNDSTIPLHRLRRTMVQHGDTVVDVLLRARYGKSVLQNIRSGSRRLTSALTA